MRRLWLGAAGLLLSIGLTGPAAAEEVKLDLAQARATVSRGVERFVAADARQGVMHVRLEAGLEDRPLKCGEVLFSLAGTKLAGRPWSDRAVARAQVRVSPPFLGQGKRNWHRPHRARLFLEDARGRRQYLPHSAIVDRPAASDGWITLSGRPTLGLPMPLGFTDAGFDPDRVARLGVNVESNNYEGETVTGTIELRDLGATFGARVKPVVLPADPKVRAGEKERARRMEARWRERFRGRTGLIPGVNLAWPSGRSPDGETMQLYGRFLDAGERWYNQLWDIGTPVVAEGVRRDLREIRELFGEAALVRVFLFGDLRTGIAFDAAGMPTAISARAQVNMARLLALAAEERVVLIPSLLDFTMADGRDRSGPDGKWNTGERMDLITDPAKRARLAALLRDFIRPHAGHPAVLAWEVMNEPENAAGAVVAERFADLQRLMVEVVDAIHEAGELATIGHRNSEDAARYFRGRVATDLGQAHYYPLLDTRPNPTPFGVKMAPVFGALPAGWGEAQALPGRVAQQIADVRRAGHRYLLLWSWRGHEDTGDGFALKPHAEEIKKALGTAAPPPAR